MKKQKDILTTTIEEVKERLQKEAREKGRQEGFIDGKGYETALVTIRIYIESLRQVYITRKVEDLKTLKTTLENSLVVLETFKRVHKEMLNKYSADSIKKLCLDYDLNKEKKDLIKAFGKVYRPLKHYVESKQASPSA